MNARFIDRPDCELCGSPDARCLLARPMTGPSVWEFLATYYQGRIDQSLLEGAEFRVMQCADCGFAWQGQVLEPAMMRRLYGEWISAEDSLNKKRFGDAALFSAYAAQAQRISTLIPKRPHEIEVLDYGMGWGYWCRTAQAFGYRVVGFEVEERRVAYAQGMGIRTISSLEDVPDAAFDFINAEQVFEHITQPLQAAVMLCRILKPDGVLRISVPDAGTLLRQLDHPGWKAGKDALHPLEHINAFTHATLVRFGAAAGMNRIVPQDVTVGLRARLRTLWPGRPAASGRASGTALLFRKPQG